MFPLADNSLTSHLKQCFVEKIIRFYIRDRNIADKEKATQKIQN